MGNFSVNLTHSAFVPAFPFGKQDSVQVVQSNVASGNSHHSQFSHAGVFNLQFSGGRFSPISLRTEEFTVDMEAVTVVVVIDVVAEVIFSAKCVPSLAIMPLTVTTTLIRLSFLKFSLNTTFK